MPLFVALLCLFALCAVPVYAQTEDFTNGVSVGEALPWSGDDDGASQPEYSTRSQRDTLQQVIVEPAIPVEEDTPPSPADALPLNAPPVSQDTQEIMTQEDGTGQIDTAIEASAPEANAPTQEEPEPLPPEPEEEEAPKHYIAVKLRALNKTTTRSEELIAPIGAATRFGNLEIVPQACWTSPPGKTPEQAGLVDVSSWQNESTTTPIFNGWLFASSPSLSALQHPVYDLTMLECMTEEPKQETPKKEESPAESAPEKPTEKPAAKKATPKKPRKK